MPDKDSPGVPLWAPAERERLTRMRDYTLTRTVADARFDELVELSAEVCETPIAWVSLLDETQLDVRASVGVDVHGLPRDGSFCEHVVSSGVELMIVSDARLDRRFREHALVTGPLAVVFYAGAALVTPDGCRLGTLCVLDRTPRTLTRTQQKTLRVLASQVTGLFHTLSTRQQTERQRDALRRLIDHLPLGLHQWRLDRGRLRLSAFNAAAEALLGFDHATRLGSEFEEIFPEVAGSKVVLDCLDVTARGGAIERTVVRRENGSPRRELRMVAYQSEWATLVTLIRDVTEHGLRERQLEQTHALLADAHVQLKRMAEGSSDAFWHRPDMSDDRLEWSDNVTSLLGYSAGSEIQSVKGFLGLLHPDDLVINSYAFRQALRKRERFDIECRIAHYTEGYRWFRLRGHSYNDRAGRKLAGSVSPIDAMIKLREELRESNRALELFTYQMSHDLQAPLVSARRLCEVIVEDMQDGDTREAMRNVIVVADQMASLETLIGGILSYMRAGAAELETDEVWPHELLSDVRGSLQEFIKAEGIEFTQTVLVHRAVPLAAVRVRQILQNLIVNGIKYRNPRVSVNRVHVLIAPYTGGIKIVVKDNGLGIPAHCQADVYTTFRRFHTRTEGSGLGLAIVKQHVDAMKGSIAFSSADAGTTFTVHIPTER